jgi:signal transduction histidine kinase
VPGTDRESASPAAPAQGLSRRPGGRFRAAHDAFLERLADVGIELPRTRRRRRERLVVSLGQVASAISSTMRTEEVLRTLVDEAKEVVGTDKAVLCLLADAGPQYRLDDRAVIVRGRRSQYPEEWWRTRIDQAAGPTMARNTPLVTEADSAWLLTVPVKIKDRPVGVLAAINPHSRPFSEDQVTLMAVLGAFAGSAIESARLHEQSSYALLASERSRIAKDMHDSLSQQLFSVSLELDVCRKRLESSPDEVEKRLERVQGVVVRSLTEVRRYIYDLRPVSLDKLGLVGAIEMRMTEITEANGLAGFCRVEGDAHPLPPGVEACLYRVAQEAMNNVARHARAHVVDVVVAYRPGGVGLAVTDDGVGFPVDECFAASDDGLGLASMSERVSAEGGTLSVQSDDGGTCVRADVPL